MNLIVVVDNNWAIGANNDLLFRLPYDLTVNFKGKTLGKTIVVGSNTLKSFPHSRALPKRTNIVLCDTGETFDNCVMATSLQELFEILRDYDSEQIFVCGGASVYKLLLPYCKVAYITKVNASRIDATAFFPCLDTLTNWANVEQSQPIIDNGYEITFNKYFNNMPKQF
ncbi:MAG: dihydrofolate reductase [Clostridia bacterium]